MHIARGLFRLGNGLQRSIQRPASRNLMNVRGLNTLAKISNSKAPAKVTPVVPQYTSADLFPTHKNSSSRIFHLIDSQRLTKEPLVVPQAGPLLKAISNPSYYMLLGPNGSGKTTMCKYVCNHLLPDSTPIYVSLRGVSADNFWVMLGEQIKSHFSFWDASHPEIKDSTTFLKFFKNHAGENIVLFIDDFNMLLPHPTLSYSFFSALLMMQYKTDIYGVQAVVAVGTSSIANISGNRPPFTRSSSWEVSGFTLEQVRQYFANLSEVDNDMVRFIFDKTQGFPALVSFCWKRICEKLKHGLSVSRLEAYVYHSLTKDMAFFSWDFVDVIDAAVSRADTLDRLVTKFLSQNEGSSTSLRSIDAPELELVNDGLLVIKRTSVQIFAPVIRECLMAKITLDKKALKLLPVVRGSLDVPKLLMNLSYFDPIVMTNVSTFKKTKRSGVTRAPCEETYKTQLYILLNTLRSLGIVVDREVGAPASPNAKDGSNSDRPRRADFVISDNGGNMTVLEVVSHVLNGPKNVHGSVQEHIQRCKDSYMKIPGVTAVFVINFTTVKPEAGYMWPTPEQHPVRVIHVWHDIAWTEARISEQAGEDTWINLRG